MKSQIKAPPMFQYSLLNSDELEKVSEKVKSTVLYQPHRKLIGSQTDYRRSGEEEKIQTLLPGLESMPSGPMPITCD
jgi:hypothetical protein